MLLKQISATEETFIHLTNIYRTPKGAKWIKQSNPCSPGAWSVCYYLWMIQGKAVN